MTEVVGVTTPTGNDGPSVEGTFSQVQALLPLIQEAETLEEVATLLDLDLSTVAGNRRALLRMINTHIDSDDFDGNPDRQRLLTSTLGTLENALSLPPLNLPPLERLAKLGTRGLMGDGSKGGLAGLALKESPGEIEQKAALLLRNQEKEQTSLLDKEALKPTPRRQKAKRSRKGRRVSSSSESDVESSEEESEVEESEDDLPDRRSARSRLTKSRKIHSKNLTSKSGALPPNPIEKSKGASTTMLSARFKDFKINGTVGDPGEKGKLTYGSLLHQVNSGVARNFDETEIIDAVIRAITPGNATRIYLEGRRDLTVNKMMRKMKNHFGEGDVSTVYKQMTNATQAQKQTPHQFITSMFAMRDRVLELAQLKTNTKKQYREKLVQEEMQRGIYAGLRDAGIRQDLRQILRQPNLDDDDLLDELQLAEASKREHEQRFEEARRRSGAVNQVSAENASSSSNTQNTQHSTTQNNKGNRNAVAPVMDMNPFVAQVTSVLEKQMQRMIQPLGAQVNELMGLKQQMQVSGKGSNQQMGSQAHNGNMSLGNQNFGGSPPFVPPGQLAPPVASGANSNMNSNNGTHPIVSSANNSGNPNFQGPLMQIQVPPGGRSWGRGRGMSNHGGAQRFPPPPHYNPNGGPGTGFSFGGSAGPGGPGAGFAAGANANNGTRRSQEDYDNRDGNSFRLCKVCQEANAWACNHCQICHDVSHRTGNCPRRNDPTFDPSKNG